MQQGCEILLVEDQVLVMADIRQKLEVAGHTLTGTARSGQEAIALFEQRQPHVVLMDIHIAGDMDGIETARSLWQQWDVPVIFLTDLRDNLTQNRAARTGRSYYLNKPLSNQQLAEVLHALFPQGPVYPAAAQDYFPDAIFCRNTKEQVDFRLSLDRIRYLQSDENYTRIYFDEPLQWHIEGKSLKALLEELSQKEGGARFRRIHKSYAVNMQHVAGRRGNELLLGNTPLLVGRSYRDSIFPLIR